MDSTAFVDKLLGRETKSYKDIDLPKAMRQEIAREAHRAGLEEAGLELFNPFHLVPIAFSIHAIKRGLEQGHSPDHDELYHLGVEASLAAALTLLSFYVTKSEHTKEYTEVYQQEWHRHDTPAKSFADAADAFRNNANDNIQGAAGISAVIGGALTALTECDVIHYPGDNHVKHIIDKVNERIPTMPVLSPAMLAAGCGAAALAAIAVAPHFRNRAVKQTNKAHDTITHVKELIAEREANKQQDDVITM